MVTWLARGALNPWPEVESPSPPVFFGFYVRLRWCQLVGPFSRPINRTWLVQPARFNLRFIQKPPGLTGFIRSDCMPDLSRGPDRRGSWFQFFSCRTAGPVLIIVPIGIRFGILGTWYQVEERDDRESVAASLCSSSPFLSSMPSKGGSKGERCCFIVFYTWLCRHVKKREGFIKCTILTVSRTIAVMYNYLSIIY